MDNLRKAAEMALNFLEDGMPADMWGMDENGYQNAIAALRQALEQPPNSTTDVVESTDSLSTLLWRDLKTDRQRADWLRLGMGYQTGVVAAAIQQELAMAYERLVGFQKMHATLEQPEQSTKCVGPVGEEWTPCVKLPVVVHVRKQREGETHVSTREGITPVKQDDLIMRGVAGEEYPIGRELFERTYTFDTAPPKREWVGLTDEEMLALIAYEPHPLANRTAIINAVERLLKEKNRG